MIKYNHNLFSNSSSYISLSEIEKEKLKPAYEKNSKTYR